MKHLYSLTLLAALCFTLPVQSQNVENDEQKRVIVIKKTIDKDGNVDVEKTVLNETHNVILSEDIHSVEVIKSDLVEIERDIEVGEINVEVEDNGDSKTIWIQHAGNEEIIELKKGEELSKEFKEKMAKEGVHVYSIDEGLEFDEDGLGNRIHEMTERLAHLDLGGDRHRAHVARVREHSNCGALGVFVGTSDGGAKVSGILEGSGAKEAGVQSGDVITGINDDKVTSVRTLHEALAKYEPGEVVNVSFIRGDQEMQLNSELRAWGQLPDYQNSWRAKVKCGDENYQEEFNFLTTPQVTKKVIIIKKGQDVSEDITVEEEIPALNASPLESVNDYALQLENFTVFPNPNDGVFRIQFEADAKPLTVSVFDGAGREVYRDNMNSFNGFYSKEVDLSNKIKGQAVVSIAQDGKRFSELMIIQ